MEMSSKLYQLWVTFYAKRMLKYHKTIAYSEYFGPVIPQGTPQPYTAIVAVRVEQFWYTITKH